MSNNELTCQELVELVTDYLENALAKPERARFEAHLAGCQGCTIYVEQARRTIRLTGRLTEAALPPAALDEFLSVFRNWKQEKDSD
jgi:hypothetical protein